jgi:predicted metal-dependent phosphoesterase TrpH
LLKFARNKLVSVLQKDANTLAVHGVLDDDIYGLEIDLIIRMADVTLLSVDGHWNRYTTPDCPRALNILSEGVGFRITSDDFSTKVHKLIGRKGCRHFANILLECCDAAVQTITLIRWQAAQVNDPELTLERFMAAPPKQPPAAEAPDQPEPDDEGVQIESASAPAQHREPMAARAEKEAGFFVDLHTHTSPASPCSSADTDALIVEARNIGLDAICLTDHNHVWSAGQIEDLRQKHGFLVLRGNEITTDQGDMLVFGVDTDIKGIIKLQDLRQAVQQADGFMIAAHPFRGFLVFGAGQLGLTAEKAQLRPLFQLVDAVETLNGKVTAKENQLAAEVAAGLNLPATGGSDAHEVDEVGQYATCFEAVLRNESDLLQALKSGAYKPVVFRE